MVTSAVKKSKGKSVVESEQTPTNQLDSPGKGDEFLPGCDKKNEPPRPESPSQRRKQATDAGHGNEKAAAPVDDGVAADKTTREEPAGGSLDETERREFEETKRTLREMTDYLSGRIGTLFTSMLEQQMPDSRISNEYDNLFSRIATWSLQFAGQDKKLDKSPGDFRPVMSPAVLARVPARCVGNGSLDSILDRKESRRTFAMVLAAQILYDQVFSVCNVGKPVAASTPGGYTAPAANILNQFNDLEKSIAQLAGSSNGTCPRGRQASRFL